MIAILLCLLLLVPAKSLLLPRCSKYGDTFGRWVNVSECRGHSELCSKHFLLGPNEALMFSQVWLPEDCAYFRFTNETLSAAIQKIAATHPATLPAYQGRVRLIFVGDSALRGIFCGITRLIGGSEIFGPSSNRVCGDCGMIQPAGYFDTAKTYDFMNKELIMTFTYSKSFNTQKHLDWMVESQIDYLPAYALIFHQGVWDYDQLARQHPDNFAPEDICNGTELEYALRGADKNFKNTMHDLGYFGGVHHKRLIFKNSHFNKRYPAVCDQQFAPLLNNSGWEIWDNHRISKAVWRDQNFDGFHFDRQKVCSVDEHVNQRKSYEAEHREYPGMLEMQLAQSLLNSIFYDVIDSLVDDVI